MREWPRKKASKLHRDRMRRWDPTEADPEPTVGRPRRPAPNEPPYEEDSPMDLGFLTGPLLEMPQLDGVEPEFFPRHHWGIDRWDWDDEGDEDFCPAR